MPEIKRLFYNSKRSIIQEVIKILNIYAHIRTSKYMKKKMIELKGWEAKFTMISVDFNTLLPIVDKTNRQESISV